jgi:hypothetical protein
VNWPSMREDALDRLTDSPAPNRPKVRYKTAISSQRLDLNPSQPRQVRPSPIEQEVDKWGREMREKRAAKLAARKEKEAADRDAWAQAIEGVRPLRNSN